MALPHPLMLITHGTRLTINVCENFFINAEYLDFLMEYFIPWPQLVWMKQRYKIKPLIMEAEYEIHKHRH